MDWTEAQDNAYTLADNALEELQIDIMQGGSTRPDWSRLTDRVRQIAPRGKEDEIASALDELANRYGWKDFVNRNPGSMYQVRLRVKPDELLDWDKPLSEQPKAVQEKLSGLGFKYNAAEMRKFDDALLDALTTDAPAAPLPPQPSNPMGSYIARGDGLFDGPAQIKKAEQLKAAGIKGIRYKDAVSRGAEGGTYNYVIFDDSLITILKRYGIPMTAAAGGGMMVMGQDMPPEVASQIGG
jgi:hypothetical protein